MGYMCRMKNMPDESNITKLEVLLSKSKFSRQPLRAVITLNIAHNLLFIFDFGELLKHLICSKFIYFLFLIIIVNNSALNFHFCVQMQPIKYFNMLIERLPALFTFFAHTQ